MGPSLFRALLRKRRAARGFSLIELLVVLTIISVVTTIALVGQATFNRSVLLTDTTYAIALSLREMQSLGLSSRKTAGVQEAGYGAYFGDASVNRLTSYVLFADTVDADASNVASFPTCQVGASLPAGNPEKKPGDCIYTAGSDQQVQPPLQLGRGFTISRYCGRSGANLYCSNDATTPLTALNIVFLRSTTETAFLARRNNAWIALSDARIYVRSPDTTDERLICLSVVGQVSVALSTCP